MKLVIIGSSTGGTAALVKLLNNVSLSCAVIIVQHMPEFINEMLRRSIEKSSGMPCRLPEELELIKEGTIYLAPSKVHLEVTPSLQITMSKTHSVNYVCPAVDITFLSLKPKANLELTGIILTGMGCDGAAGIKYLKSIGGKVLVQSPDNCVVDGMPMAALNTGVVDFQGDLPDIRQYLTEQFGSGPKP